MCAIVPLDDADEPPLTRAQSQGVVDALALAPLGQCDALATSTLATALRPSWRASASCKTKAACRHAAASYKRTFASARGSACARLQHTTAAGRRSTPADVGVQGVSA